MKNVVLVSHAVFDNVFKAANLIPHDTWRTSHLIHYNHSLGSEQWILLYRWFDRHLNGMPGDLPKSVNPILKLNSASAHFTDPTNLKLISKIEWIQQ